MTFLSKDVINSYAQKFCVSNISDSFVIIVNVHINNGAVFRYTLYTIRFIKIWRYQINSEPFVYLFTHFTDISFQVCTVVISNNKGKPLTTLKQSCRNQWQLYFKLCTNSTKSTQFISPDKCTIFILKILLNQVAAVFCIWLVK